MQVKRCHQQKRGYEAKYAAKAGGDMKPVNRD